MIDSQRFLTPTPSQPQMSADFNWQTIRHTVVKFCEPVTPNTTATSATEPLISATTWQAWEQLITMIRHLRSPQGGWPRHLPQTPQTLLPYLIEEASEVFDACQQVDQKTDATENTPAPAQQPLPSLVFIKDLTPLLLWYMGRSSEQIMRLLSGVNGKLLTSAHHWSEGTLRFVTILKVESPEIQWQIDLATHQPPPPCLPVTCVLQSSELSDLMIAQPCDHLLQKWQTQLQKSTPETSLFSQPLDVDLLVPGGEWEPGYLQLDFRLYFVNLAGNLTPGFSDLTPDQPVTVQVVPDVTPPITREATPAPIFTLKSSRSISEATIKPWGELPPSADILLQQHALKTLIEKTQTAPALPSESLDPISLNDLLDQSLPTSIATVLEDIVTTADQTLEHLNTLPNNSADPTQPTVTHLTLHLFWQIIKSSYAAMQLIGGVKAQVLQSGYPWQTGILRLLAQLNLEVGNQTWEIDIATDQILGGTLPLVPDAILQSYQTDCTQEPLEAQTLIERILTQLEENSPDLKPWLAGKSLELEQRGWQVAQARLSLQLEFIADTQPSVYWG